MTPQQFETLCRRSRFKPIAKYTTAHGTILIAEGYRHFNPEFPKPHWAMLWAIERAGMDMAQRLYFEFGQVHPELGIITRQKRIEATRQVAEQWIRDNVVVGRYG